MSQQIFLPFQSYVVVVVVEIGAAVSVLATAAATDAAIRGGDRITYFWTTCCDMPQTHNDDAPAHFKAFQR